MKNRNNEIHSNEIHIRRELPVFDMYSKSVRTTVVRRGVDSFLNPEGGGLAVV